MQVYTHNHTHVLNVTIDSWLFYFSELFDSYEKPVSENVICWSCPQHVNVDVNDSFLLIKSLDPDLTALTGVAWSGSTLYTDLTTPWEAAWSGYTLFATNIF